MHTRENISLFASISYARNYQIPWACLL